MRNPNVASPEPEAKALAFVGPKSDLSDDEIAHLRLAVGAQVHRVLAHLLVHSEAWDVSGDELGVLRKEAGRCA